MFLLLVVPAPPHQEKVAFIDPNANGEDSKSHRPSHDTQHAISVAHLY